MSDFFSASDIDELEAVAESAMSGTLVIKRRTNSSNGDGTFSVTYPAVGTVACHVWRDRYGSEKIGGAQVLSEANWYIAVPNGTDIREIDRCDYNGTVTYEITQVPLGITWNPHLRCEAVTLNRELRT